MNIQRKIITSVYKKFEDTEKKLKIVCDWDEVIQSHEPFALWKAINNLEEKNFPQFFKYFWDEETIEYSPYGSRLLTNNLFNDKQLKIKNSPDFYQKAPFLTIAEDLLKLIKEDKVERLIFLSAYDKRKFPSGDPRKWEIFNQTFCKQGIFNKSLFIELSLIGFDSEEKGRTKADWIKENAVDFDLVIDDN